MAWVECPPRRPRYSRACWPDCPGVSVPQFAIREMGTVSVPTSGGLRVGRRELNVGVSTLSVLPVLILLAADDSWKLEVSCGEGALSPPVIAGNQGCRGS